jgi:hypothetical protein
MHDGKLNGALALGLLLAIALACNFNVNRTPRQRATQHAAERRSASE